MKHKPSATAGAKKESEITQTLAPKPTIISSQT